MYQFEEGNYTFIVRTNAIKTIRLRYFCNMLYTSVKRHIYQRFCTDFLNDCNSYLLPKYFQDELRKIDLSSDNIIQNMTIIMKTLFSYEINCGSFMIALGFTKILCKRYGSHYKHQLIEIILNEIETIPHFHLLNEI